MAIIVSSGRRRGLERITNRTDFSGGSIGGDKKPGIVTRSGQWFNVRASAFWRAPQTIPTRAILYLFTESHPTQRYGYRATHGMM